jgi:hypothetical protein
VVFIVLVALFAVKAKMNQNVENTGTDATPTK